MVSYNPSKQLLDNHQRGSILYLAYHDVLLLSIFFPFQGYRIENKASEKWEIFHLLHRHSKLFFFFANRLSTPPTLSGVDTPVV